MRFGGSTRFYVLGSPQQDDDDDEEESEKVQNKKGKRKNDDEDEDTGCSWGMSGRDAQYDDENEDVSNFKTLEMIILEMKEKSSSSTKESPNKSSYCENAYKCLQQWFFQEGYDFDYKVSEHSKQFKCLIELPVDGQFIPIDGDLFGKVSKFYNLIQF